MIRARAFEEVKLYNEELADRFEGPVQPEGSEREREGFRLHQPRKLDWHEQSRAALEAFERNGFLFLVDDRQLGTPDEEIRVRSDTRVTFLKLVPLMGE